MSYAAKGEKVFDWQSQTDSDYTPSFRRSDHRLKRFSSTYDKRAWHPCEEIRYRHLYDLMSGSQTCLSTSQCHKYVPLEDLIKILMAEKDALIREMQERLRRCSQSQGDSDTEKQTAEDHTIKDITTKGKTTKGKTSEDKTTEDKATGDKTIKDIRAEDKTLLQSQVMELTEEVNKSRNMLREAMHKLQNIDEILNENKKLQCRLRCSEERIKYLEERKRHLESELADLRSKSQIQMDLEKAQEMLSKVTQQREESIEMDEVVLQTLTLERDELQEKVKKLEKELEDSKKKETEIEMLKKQSQTDSLDKEEMSRENECYRKKLASMKCLEKQIQELKKQGRALADKYKREAQKAAEQMSKMCQVAKELQSLREERDCLRKRVNELASYECQYNKLQRKLQRVDAVIAENENLNSKLLSLQNLEKENEYLRCKLEAVQEMETSAAEDKERIEQLQCAIADQEEEMKDLLCQIERLTSERHEEELERLKCELYEKNSKLKLCEEQLAEIPMLEAEIDELRMKVQCCCRQFPDRKTGENSYQKIEVRLPSTSKEIRANYKSPEEICSSVIEIKKEETVEVENKFDNCHRIMQAQNTTAYKITSQFKKKSDMMSCEEVQNLLYSSKGIISCVLEDMIEHQREMEELEMCNRAMKEEIDALKEKIGCSEKESLLQEISKLKKCLKNKDFEISKLRSHGLNGQGSDDVETLRQLNEEMKCELEGTDEGRLLIKEPGGFISPQESSPSKARKVSLIEESEYCKALQRETNDLKLQIEALNKLTNELKKENELLRELQQPCPDFSKQLDEKCALENLLSSLQAELDAFKGQKLSNECEALRNELKRVMEQNCDLKTLVDCYRQRLELEKKSTQLKTKTSFPANKEQVISPLDSTGKQAGNIPKSQERDKDLETKLSEDGLTGGSEEIKRGKPGDIEGITESSEPGSVRGKNIIPGSLQTDSLETENNIPGRVKTESAAPRNLELGSVKPKNVAAESLEPGSTKVKSEESGNVKTQGMPPGSVKPETFVAGSTESGGAKPKSVEPGSAKANSAEAGSARTESAEPGDIKSKNVPGATKMESAEQKSAKTENVKPEGAETTKMLPADCFKELERLKKENTELAKKLETGGPTPGGEIAKLQEKLKQVEAENANKLKKLMDQHEKELANREKTYNENLKAMKTGYETDIRKLTERHKQSVVRLQELHQDEVQEMNSNYEAQLDMMQTQSEAAINDIVQGSAAKIRKMAEKHSKEVGELRDSLTRSAKELETLRRKENGFHDEDPSQLKIQQARLMQKMRRTSKQKLSAMKMKYEESKMMLEEETEGLKKKLRDQAKGEEEHEYHFGKKKPRRPRDPSYPLDFYEVLEKILQEGLDSLTFNEIALVHRKTCCALEGIVMKSNSSPMVELEPPVNDSCPHTPLLEADKQQLLSRIFALENEIHEKQKQTQDAIISMEVAIKKERGRLQELRNSLETEQQKNSKLKLLLSSQTKIHSDLKRERDRLGNEASMHQILWQERTKQLDEEIRTKKYLQMEIAKLKSDLKQLCAALDAERGKCSPLQRDPVEQMRVKLEQSIHQDRTLALKLENEAKCRMQLPSPNQGLKRSLRHMVTLPAVGNDLGFSQNPLEAKSAKEKQNLDQIKEKKNKMKTKCKKQKK